MAFFGQMTLVQFDEENNLNLNPSSSLSKQQDIATTSLEQCQERYKKFTEEQNRRNKRIYSCEFFPADATRDSLRDKLKNPNMLFDLAVIQFAYHYSFETIEQATKMIENVSRNLREGGYFVGSTVNANKVVAHTLAQKKLKFGNELFSIEFPEQALAGERVPLFGNTYQFRLDDVVDCPEFLVHFPTVVQIAKRFNLELHWQKRFEDYYLENIDDPEKRKLLQRMNALKAFPLNERTDEQQIASEYAKAANYQKNNPQLDINEVKRIGTISKSEWEACSLYMVFAFKKVTPRN